MAATRVANADMEAAWDGPEGEHWAANADHYEKAAARHWHQLLAATAVPQVASVLDVGCGTGGSTRSLARLAREGSVLGFDLSSAMLRVAARRAADDGLTNVRFERGDAQVHPFGRGENDLVVSAFGAMFFEDPVAAFANLHTSLKPGGALALAAWRSLSSNEWVGSLRHALAVGRDLPAPPANAPGPFGLADEEHVHRVLTAAGFHEVTLTAHDAPMWFGRDADDAFAFMGSTGIAHGLTQDLDQENRERAFANLRRLIEDHVQPDGVLFDSSAWLIGATA